MKRIWCILILLMVFSFGCDNYAPKQGKPTIEEAKMAEMVTDVHIIEAYLQNVGAKQRDSVKTVLYREFFEMYKIDTAEFYKNQRIYYNNPEAVEKLYEDVLNNLVEKDNPTKNKN